MTTPAWIGLGSNLGDRRAILDAALAALAGVSGVDVRAVSSYHETRPVGGPPGQGPFLNAAAHLETTLDPHQLLAVLQEIENHSGRVRTVRWGERTLDLDILIYGTKFHDTKELKLPHPRLAFRRFVLAPLAEIAPTIVDTMTKRTITELLANLDRRPRLLALEGPGGPLKSAVFDRLVDALPAFGIGEIDVTSGLDPTGDPARSELSRFGGKVETLRADRWMPETLRTPWIVADYCLAFDRDRSVSAVLRRLAQLPQGESSREAYEAYYGGIRRIQEAEKHALSPTLAILLPGTELDRRPGRARFPLLQPDSDEPDAIVAEVLATCRAIEGV